MKRLFVFALSMLFASIACQTLQPTAPAVTATPAVETLAISTARPTPVPIICTDDSCLDACLTRINSTLGTRQFESLGGEYAGTSANLNLVIYTVENGNLGEPDILYAPAEFKPFQEDFQAQEVVWKYASSLLPADQLNLISEYDIFTDGTDNVLAWVTVRDDLDRSRWQLGVDIADAQNPVDLTYTLIHEFGHLISLNSEQITQTEFYFGWNQNPATCAQLTTPEGCSTPGSYINLFYQDFWTGIFDEWREMVEKPQINSDEEFRVLVHDFYLKHEDQFVREYAATNIREDLAESFMHFVLEPRPAGTGIADQKILFLYNFPELVSMRRQMIQNVCSYTQE
ncbi:MAG: hypothetical protein K8S20_08755 [Chloroflexi bacterium]|nr:hypothetical protein [Chloroflexota bacterium]